MPSESEAQEAVERQARAEGGFARDQDSAPEERSSPAPRADTDPEQGVRIPLEELSDEALHAIVEEFVTRDGTEHTEGERKVAQVMALLERGDAGVWFNEKTRTCNILRVDRY